MKQKLIIVLLILMVYKANAQKVINNIFLNNIDDIVAEEDSTIAKLRITELEVFFCDSSKLKDTCLLQTRMYYDGKGRVEKLVKGENLLNGPIDFTVKFKKIADTLFQSIAEYPENSSELPGFAFVDTVIKGKQLRYFFYKKNKNNYVEIRSLYGGLFERKFGDKKIDRYDLNDSLVHVFFPFPRRIPQKDWADTVIHELKKEIIYSAIYGENYFSSTNVYNNLNQLIESTYVNYTFDRKENSCTKEAYIYDKNKLVLKVTTDELNQIISEERYYYKDEILNRYTKDYKPADDLLNEERSYDEKGRLVFSVTRSPYSNKVESSKHLYDTNGLKLADEYYSDGTILFKYIYKYKQHD